MLNIIRKLFFGNIEDEHMYRWCQVEFKKDADFAYHLMRKGENPMKHLRSTQL